MMWKRRNSSSTEPCRKMEVGEDQDTLTTGGSETPGLKASHFWRKRGLLYCTFIYSSERKRNSPSLLQPNLLPVP